MTLSCDDYRVAISDAIDGAAPAIDDSLVQAHLAPCAACRGFAERSAELRRRSRVQAAPDMLAVPDLLATGDAAHSARHLGAFSVAYAVGLIVVVVRPARARTMFHVAIVLAAGMVVTAVVDIAQGRVPLVNEALHIPELFSVLFLWLLARPRPDAPASAGPADAGPGDTGLGDTVHDDADVAEVHQLRPRRHDR